MASSKRGKHELVCKGENPSGTLLFCARVRAQWERITSTRGTCYAEACGEAEAQACCAKEENDNAS